MECLFQGVATALITPFRDGKIDYDSLSRLIARQTAAGIPALAVCGTTGEGSVLSYREAARVIRHTRKEFPGVLIAGCGANCTDRAVDLAERAADAGADALLAVTPYYNKANRAGLIAHYRALCRVGRPVIVYHVPSRTGLRLTVDDFAALAELPGICGFKEASGDLSLLHALTAVPGSPPVWVGNDDSIRAAALLGARGVISVVSNLLPAEAIRLWEAGTLRDSDASAELHRSLSERVASLGWEVNPIPVKYVASRMGLCSCEYRLPLAPPSPSVARRLDAVWGGN